MKIRFWPRTLPVQLVAVTILAVLMSNLAVAYWFERGNERQNEVLLNDRIQDRALWVTTLMSKVPEAARQNAIRAVNQGPWRFSINEGPVGLVPMNDDEQRAANRIRAGLPEELKNFPVTVKQTTFRFPPRHPGGQPSQPFASVEIHAPLDNGHQVLARYIRFDDGPRWPFENSIAALVGIILTSIGAALVARRVSRPLSQLTAAAAKAAAGGQAPRVPEEGPEDVKRAAIAFNAMNDQVTRTLESQRQLLSAVGHDLRTPITAMRINLEFVPDDELRERLERNLGELQQLTESVLSAAKGAGGEPKRQVDLGALVDSLCADFEDMGKPVDCEGLAPTPFACRSNEITRAVRNLVENAIAYGHVAHVRMKTGTEAVDIVVEDDGPGIPDADRERVFEPFVRLETSRNLDTGGTGLGLGLVKAIAEGHGGKVTLENRAEGGLRATLHLPRQGQSA